MTRTIAIIGALNEEIAHIAEALDNTTHATAASLDITCGTLAANSGEELSVAATVGGMGLVAAAATTQHLIDVYHPEAIIFSGIAGNLNKRLHINDVVLGGTLRYLDTDMRLVGQWKPGTEQNPIEEFHSDRHLLDVADKVEEVIRATGADAVEMEGAAVAQVAARNDVPALVIRALSDNADTDYEEFKGFDISEYANTAANLTVDLLRRL